MVKIFSRVLRADHLDYCKLIRTRTIKKVWLTLISKMARLLPLFITKTYATNQEVSKSNLSNKCLQKLVVFSESTVCIFSSCRISIWLIQFTMSRLSVMNTLTVTEMLDHPTITTIWDMLLILRRNAMAMRLTSILNLMSININP